LPRRGVAQPGRALSSGGRGREFKSRHPDQSNDLNEAKRIALNKYDELYAQVASGRPLNEVGSKRFDEVIDEWTKNYILIRNKDSKPENTKITTERVNGYIRTYFCDDSNNPRLDDISDDLIRGFTNFRLQASVSTNTIRRELNLIRQILRFAVDRSYISQLPNITLPQKRVIRRSTFSKEDYKKLYRELRRSTSAAVNNTRVYRSRFYLQQYVLILANVGARVGEIRDLRWEHIARVTYEGQDRRVLRLKGKTGERMSAMNSGAERYLFRLYDFRREELGRNPPQSEFVFCSNNGLPIGSYKKGFDSVCSQADILHDSEGNKRSLYSLRHFYAHRRIIDANVSVYELANHMGTSVEMIEMHYGPQLNIASSIKVSQTSHTVGETENNYPF